jgi:hypothetical protein
MMIALVLELCGGVCAFSTIVFLALASISKFMPDLERDETAPSAQAYEANRPGNVAAQIHRQSASA